MLNIAYRDAEKRRDAQARQTPSRPQLRLFSRGQRHPLRHVADNVDRDFEEISQDLLQPFRIPTVAAEMACVGETRMRAQVALFQLPRLAMPMSEAR